MSRQVCIYPRVTSPGGVGTFQANLSKGLLVRGIHVGNDLDDRANDVILVLAGTRNLPGLWQARRRGVPIVQRLDGINWIHRKRPVSLWHSLRAEYGNLNLFLIRSCFADQIVYQSDFVRRWWEDWYGPTQTPSKVIHNGVDLQVYSPDGPQTRPSERLRLLLVEGNLGGGYDKGLENAIRLTEALVEQHDFPMELMVVGKVEPGLQARWQASSRLPIIWVGQVERECIPEIDRSAHLFFTADIHTACPNSVIEALACGLPVVGFDTGAVRELVLPTAGRVVPYGGDPWRIDPPDVPTLAKAAKEVLGELARFRVGARAHAESTLGLDRMLEKYLEVLFPENGN